MSCACMQEQEIAAVRAEVTALKRVHRPSAVVEPAQHASQTHDQHPHPQKGSGSHHRSIRDSASPAQSAPTQHTTPCRPQETPVDMAATPSPAKVKEAASGAAKAGISSQPVSLQPSCAIKHTVLGKRDNSGGLKGRQGEFLQPAADTADELEVGLCAGISDVICRSLTGAKSDVTAQVWDAASALS